MVIPYTSSATAGENVGMYGVNVQIICITIHLTFIDLKRYLITLNVRKLVLVRFEIPFNP